MKMMEKIREGMKKILEKLEKIRKYTDWPLFIIMPALIFYFTQIMLGSRVFGRIEIQLILLNVLIFEAIAFFFLGITRRMRISLLLEMVPIWFFALANTYVRMFRGSYIMPWDFVAIRTAANVAGNYSYQMDPHAKNGTIALIILGILICVFVSNKKRELSPLRRGMMSVFSALFILLLGTLLSKEDIAGRLKLHDSMFAVTKSYTGNGMMLGFLYKLQRVFVEKPEGYSRASASEILDGMDPGESRKTGKELPDIIVVMNESFADLKTDGDFTVNKDYMPFIHSLRGKEDTVTGFAHVSVLGGQTPNSEFEFLTGNSMAFLPENSIPFQMYVRRKMDALPWYLTSMGYFSLAMHPYNSSGWDRTIAWPYLGFQETRYLDYFNQVMPDAKLIRDYISDEALNDLTIEKLESRDDPDQPMFAFLVTMQNHSSYSKMYDNFTPEISVEGADNMEDENQRSLTNYLSLVYESDKAFEKLVKHYENAGRDTIILLFGDHQPDLDVMEPIYTMNGKDVENLTDEDTINNHMVPFVIWANFDIEEKSDVDLSLNYLGNLLLEEAGIPLTRYRTYTEGVRSGYPVISAIGGRDAQGSIKDVKELRSELNELSCLQYYEMFDDNDDYY